MSRNLAMLTALCASIAIPFAMGAYRVYSLSMRKDIERLNYLEIPENPEEDIQYSSKKESEE